MKMKLINIWVMSVISVITEMADCDGDSQISDNDTTEVTELTTAFTQSITTEPPDITTLSTVKPSTLAYWLTKTGIINDDLINIQAVIVKDEDAEISCNKGERKS